MKNLYRKGKVHPSPSSAQQSTDPILALLLCSLPPTILALTATLSPEDRQVLAYLLNNSNNYNYIHNNSKAHSTSSSSSSSFGKKKSPEEKKGEHPPLFDCSCFRCYTSFWVRWDSSPNRHLIHEILEAFEDSLHKAPKSRKQQQQNNQRRKQGRRAEEDGRESESSGEILKESCLDSEVVGLGEEDGVEEGEKGGTVGRLVSFIGERIWGAWSH